MLLLAALFSVPLPLSQNNENRSHHFDFKEVVPRARDPSALVRRMEDNLRGTTFRATLRMTVTKPGLERALTLKLWTKGRDKAVIKVLEPARDRGVANLRLGLDLWQFVPNVDRVIRIPPSLMLQNWMGSNFTNDDVVRLSSLSTDYTHRWLGEDTIDGVRVAKIECLPRPTAPVVWGKVTGWITLDHAVGVRQEFHTENGKLVKSLTGSDVRPFGAHFAPTTLVMRSARDDGASTRIEYSDVVYDGEIADRVFTQQNLRGP